MKKIELLSPAGSYECLVAAIQAGCDAVYISGKSFGARAYADNFSNLDIVEAIKYAHERNVLIYVTVNTLVFDDEIDEIREYLSFLSNNDVDAVIVQDVGIVRLIKKEFPNLCVHASTQMNIFSKTGIDNALLLGIERVVLSREVSLDEIKSFISESMEIEVFVHGALCFSQSGNCYLSSFIGNRSGNRGKCAQPCRKTYKLKEDNEVILGNKAYLSMKDLNTIEYIEQLIKCGISSLKIEGRMKKKEYVYYVTKFYKEAIECAYKKMQFKYTSDIDNIIKKTFNREFTKGYLLSDNNSNLTNTLFVNHQGISIGKVVKRTDKEVYIKLCDTLNVQDGLRIISKNELGILVSRMYIGNNVVKTAKANDIVRIDIPNKVCINDDVRKTYDSLLTKDLNNRLRDESCKTKVNMTLYAYKNKEIKLVIKTELLETVTVCGNILEESTSYLNHNRITEQLSKLGNTVFVLNELSINSDDCCFISISELNDLRRRGVQLLLSNRLNNKLSNTKDYLLSNTISNNLSNINNIINFDIVLDEKMYDNVLNNMDKILSFNNDSSCTININLFKKYDNYYDRLTELNNKYDELSFIHNLNQYQYNSNNEVIISPYANVTNVSSVKVLNELGIHNIYLSGELSIDRIKKITKYNQQYNSYGMLIYGAYELMVSKHCLVGKEKNKLNKHCLSCINHKYELIDEFSNHYPLSFNNHNCIMYINDSKKVNLINEINNIIDNNINRLLFIFDNESINDIKDTISLFVNKITKKTNIIKNNAYIGHFNDKI